MFHVKPFSLRPGRQVQRSRIDGGNKYLRSQLRQGTEYPCLVIGIQFTGEIVEQEGTACMASLVLQHDLTHHEGRDHGLLLPTRKMRLHRLAV